MNPPPDLSERPARWLDPPMVVVVLCGLFGLVGILGGVVVFSRGYEQRLGALEGGQQISRVNAERIEVMQGRLRDVEDRQLVYHSEMRERHDRIERILAKVEEVCLFDAP